MAINLVWRTSLKRTRSAIVERWFGVIWLTWMLVVATKRLIKTFPAPDAPLNGDAFWTYLPNARQFIAKPWEFMTTDPTSFYVAPLSFIWPALWGADAPLTQLANSILFLLSIVMLWRLTTRVAGLWAGCVSTALLVYNPDIVLHIPQVLTEAMYLFGFMLFLMATAEYLLAPQRRKLWLSAAAVGLTITLLSRPVWQVYTLMALVLVIAGMVLRRNTAHSYTKGWGLAFNFAVAMSLSGAMVLPTATVVLNGLYLQYWALSTGAGSGLYYGVSPFEMGVEPIYSGFNHDASIIPLTADPSTKGHPLSPRSDEILTKVAVSIVKNTSLTDNISFFLFKLKAWLFFGPEDLRIQPKLRWYRTLEWLSILVGLTTLIVSASRHFGLKAKRYLPSPDLLPNRDGLGYRRLAMVGFLILLLAGMTAQLLPVLYNLRYNLFFMEPMLIPLSGISIAMLLRYRTPAHATADQSAPRRVWRCILWLTPRLVIAVLLMHLPTVLTQSAARHRAWSMDPLRPGPTQVLLDQQNIGQPAATNARPTGERRWVITQRPGILQIPLSFDSNINTTYFLNGMWRLKLAVKAPYEDRNCHNVHMALSHAQRSDIWYIPEPLFHIPLDGQLHLSAIHGNGELRPAGPGSIALTFNCPEGTTIEWAGAQFLRVTMPEAARELITNKTPINPYRPDDIR